MPERLPGQGRPKVYVAQDLCGEFQLVGGKTSLPAQVLPRRLEKGPAIPDGANPQPRCQTLGGTPEEKGVILLFHIKGVILLFQWFNREKGSFIFFRDRSTRSVITVSYQ